MRAEMTLFEATFLGIVQGVTEFLPISSSGHLVLFQSLFGVKEPQLFFDVMLHFGTLLAVILYFRTDLHVLLRDIGSALTRGDKKRPGVRLFALVFIANLPTGLMGILFRDWFESLFAQPKTAGGMLLITGTILYLTRWAQKGGKGLMEMRWTDALLIGVAQGVALLPGISRSGATLSAGLFLGVKREWAGRFSFLISIPAIAGATFMEFLGVNSITGLHTAATGAAIAFLTGLLSLIFLMKVIQKGRLYHFSYYCWGMGSAILWIS